MQYAELRHVPGDDSRLRSDEGEGYRCAGGSLIALSNLLAMGEKAHAEGLLVLEAGLGHVDVSLLKHLERQHPSGKQDGLQRKQRQRRRAHVDRREGRETFAASGLWSQASGTLDKRRSGANGAPARAERMADA